jgi:hypothetical protein
VRSAAALDRVIAPGGSPEGSAGVATLRPASSPRSNFNRDDGTERRSLVDDGLGTHGRRRLVQAIVPAQLTNGGRGCLSFLRSHTWR